MWHSEVGAEENIRPEKPTRWAWEEESKQKNPGWKREVEKCGEEWARKRI